MASAEHGAGAAMSTTFTKDASIRVNDEGIGAASISPSGRDVVLASKSGLHIVDLDSPYSPARHIIHRTNWDVADVQWSPFACRPGRIATTSNQKALIFNLEIPSFRRDKAAVEFTLHSHERAITDINFSAHHPDILATCAVDSFVYTWDLRNPPESQHVTSFNRQPLAAFAEFTAGATQVKWNRQNEHILASSHDKFLKVWDDRNGALPVTTIVAHGTKIYGIDWHRADATKILTCSLDKTIKFWDDVGYKAEITKPSKVIRSYHPVGRARHTPFPNGVLAMPQRGSSALSLYTHSSGQAESDLKVTQPVYTFEAHEGGARVQEFLWRSRGSIEDGRDNREFQLISWGTDLNLHLYSVAPDLLEETVGFRKGGPVTEAPSTTRKGAKYVTFRDDPPRPTYSDRPRPAYTPGSGQQGVLSSMIQSAAHLRLNATSFSYLDTGPQRETMTPGNIRNSGFGRKVASFATYLSGVKVGERSTVKDNKEQQHGKGDGHDKWATHDDLAAEVRHVGEVYPNLDWEKSTSIENRRVTVSFQGPWGDFVKPNDPNSERKLAFLRITVTFPDDYPHLSVAYTEDGLFEEEKRPNPLQIEFQKTTAAIDDATLTRLKEDMTQIANRRAALGRDALEAIVCYALGERDLENSLVIPGEAPDDQEDHQPVDEDSSSSEEDDDAEQMGDGNDGTYPGNDMSDALNSSTLANANTPTPIQCTMSFSASGALVLARLPLQASAPSPSTGALRLTRLQAQSLNRDEIFESFGRLNMPHGYDSESPTSSTDSFEFESSISSSSGSNNEAGVPLTGFQPPMAWQNPALRFSRTSHPSSIAAPTKAIKAKSVVTILESSVEVFIPSKRCLAEEYWIFGDGPQVCSHNADVARRFGYEDLADFWELCKLILTNEVPLEILPQQNRREQVLVLARRALVRIKRKDSGLDLTFDETDTVTNPRLKGRVKWGHHSVVTWLIPALFDHFERLADTQMLAMLSCIFSEPATREGVTSAMAKVKSSDLPMSMAAPAFSLDYFPSADAAWSMFKSSLSIPSTPAYSRYATPANEFGWHRLTKALDTHGSHGSSNGPWGSDTVPSEPVTPYSTGNTPPSMSRVSTARSTAAPTPYGTSPEQASHIAKKPSAGNFASAFASLSRPFANAISSSPPVKNLNRSEADLSTSAPTSGVTWGTTTFYSGSGEQNVTTPRAKSNKRASFGQADRVNIDYYSDSDSAYDDSGPAFDTIPEYATPGMPGGSDEDNNIRVTLKNQDQFDDEGCVSAPLLDMSKEWLHRAWRDQYAELLGSWGLISQRAEILKFNGLTSYFPLTDSSRSTSNANSMHLGLRTPTGSGNETPLPGNLSRTSSMLVPPASQTPQYRRSPLSSPRHFSFNPEAPDFQPGTSFERVNTALLAPPPEASVSTEQYLRLSIPTPVQPELLADAGFFDGTATTASTPTHSHSRSHSKSLSTFTSAQRSLRPSLSRTVTVAKHPSLAGIPVHNGLKRGSTDKDKKKEPIYSCSICWIRVSGRFFLCPSCGHVAHFDCMNIPSHSDNGFMDEGLGIFHGYQGWEEGDCVVGCGCGCGFFIDENGDGDGNTLMLRGDRSPYSRADTEIPIPIPRSPIPGTSKLGMGPGPVPGSPEDYFRRWEDSGAFKGSGASRGTRSPSHTSGLTPGFEEAYGHEEAYFEAEGKGGKKMGGAAGREKVAGGVSPVQLKKGRWREVRKGVRRSATTD